MKTVREYFWVLCLFTVVFAPLKWAFGASQKQSVIQRPLTAASVQSDAKKIDITSLFRPQIWGSSWQDAQQSRLNQFQVHVEQDLGERSIEWNAGEPIPTPQIFQSRILKDPELLNFESPKAFMWPFSDGNGYMNPEGEVVDRAY